MTWGELIKDLEGYGFTDHNGHTLEKAMFWNVIKDSFVAVWEEQVPEEFLENHTGPEDVV